MASRSAAMAASRRPPCRAARRRRHHRSDRCRLADPPATIQPVRAMFPTAAALARRRTARCAGSCCAVAARRHARLPRARCRDHRATTRVPPPARAGLRGRCRASSLRRAPLELRHNARAASGTTATPGSRTRCPDTAGNCGDSAIPLRPCNRAGRDSRRSGSAGSAHATDRERRGSLRAHRPAARAVRTGTPPRPARRRSRDPATASARTRAARRRCARDNRRSRPAPRARQRCADRQRSRVRPSPAHGRVAWRRRCTGTRPR